MSRADIVDLVTRLRLKGRGGAGFPTGMKWGFAAAEKAEPKYIICNADEGEPGTFKDRVILTDFADLVFEGMTIGGRAMGASMGLVYLRGEYSYLRHPPQRRSSRRAAPPACSARTSAASRASTSTSSSRSAPAPTSAAKRRPSSSRSRASAASRATARRSPWSTASRHAERRQQRRDAGLGGLASSPRASTGSRAIGTDKSTGYKLFSISGDCAQPGVYEFPLGITVADLLEEVGGEDAKAVQIGGASGTCIPSTDFSRQLAFEDIPTGGSVIVIGPQRDMLAVAQNFLDFFVDESCGQCTPCRMGNAKLLEAAELLKEGNCSTEYLDELRELSATMQVACKCGLGQTSSIAFLSILEHFSDEILGRTPRRDERGTEMTDEPQTKIAAHR